MLKVNLLPKEDIEKHAIGKFLKWTLSYGRFIIIVVELIVFLVFFSRFIYDQKLADINERVEQKQAIVASAADFEEKIREIQTRIEQVKSLDEGRTVYLTILAKLKQIVPTDMVFTKLDFEEEKLTIEGQTSTNESFAKFIIALKSDELFSEISIETVGKKDQEEQNTQESSKPEENVIEFKITGILEGYKKLEPTPELAAPVSTEEESTTNEAN